MNVTERGVCEQSWTAAVPRRSPMRPKCPPCDDGKLLPARGRCRRARGGDGTDEMR